MQYWFFLLNKGEIDALLKIAGTEQLRRAPETAGYFTQENF
jgi:hypothetical protein